MTRTDAVLREAFVAFAERCDSFLDGDDMDPFAFMIAWREEVEARLRPLLDQLKED